MDVSVTRTTYGAASHAWLASAHGTDAARTVTLAIAAFTKATHYPDGHLPDGLPLAIPTSGTRAGLAVPVVDSASDGSQILAGYLLHPVEVPTSGANPAGALLDRGRVRTAATPVATTATQRATNVRFSYV